MRSPHPILSSLLSIPLLSALTLGCGPEPVRASSNGGASRNLTDTSSSPELSNLTAGNSPNLVGTYDAPLELDPSFDGDFLSITLNPDFTFSVAQVSASGSVVVQTGTYAFTQSAANAEGVVTPVGITMLALQFAEFEGGGPQTIYYSYQAAATTTYGASTFTGIELAAYNGGFSEPLDSNHFFVQRAVACTSNGGSGPTAGTGSGASTSSTPGSPASAANPAALVGTYVAPLSENQSFDGDFLTLTFNADSTMSGVTPNGQTEAGTFSFGQDNGTPVLVIQAAGQTSNFQYAIPATATFGSSTLQGIALAQLDPSDGFLPSEPLDANHFLVQQGTEPRGLDHTLSNNLFGYSGLFDAQEENGLTVFPGDAIDLFLADNGTWQGHGYPALQSIDGTWSTFQNGSASLLTLFNQDGSTFDNYMYSLSAAQTLCTTMGGLQLTTYTGTRFALQSNSLLNP